MKTVTKDTFLKQMLNIEKNLFNLQEDLSFSPERKKIRKCSKLLCTVQDKEKYVVHIGALKQALNHGLILKNVHRVIQFN